MSSSLSITPELWRKAIMFASSHLNDREDQKDVAQEACIRLYETSLAGVVIDNPLSWLRGTVRHIAIDWIRRRGWSILTQPNNVFLDQQLESYKANITRSKVKFENERDLLTDLTSDFDLESSAINRDMLSAALSIIAELPDRDRECILMHARGYTFYQIGSALNLGYHQARRITLHALVKTRRRLNHG